MAGKAPSFLINPISGVCMQQDPANFVPGTSSAFSGCRVQRAHSSPSPGRTRSLQLVADPLVYFWRGTAPSRVPAEGAGAGARTLRALLQRFSGGRARDAAVGRCWQGLQSVGAT